MGSGPQERCYSLSVRVDTRWVHVRVILARSHGQAFRKALLALKPEYQDKPIRLEEFPGPFTPDK